MQARALLLASLVLACATPELASPTAPIEQRRSSPLEDNSFPIDPPGQPGAARAAWIAMRGSAEEIGAAAERYAADAREGRLDPGLWALIRVQYGIDPAPPAGTEAYAERFQHEWDAAKAHLAALSPPTNLGEEFFRRVTLEQFGRNSLTGLWRTYPPGAARDAAQQRIWDNIRPADLDNTARLRALLAQRDWFDDARDGAGAQADAWLMVQHADESPDFQREMLGRLEPLIGSRVRPQDYALLWDRVAVKDSRPQRYGSQVRCQNGEWAPIGGVEAPEALEQRRAAMSLGPWSEYAARMTQLNGACPS